MPIETSIISRLQPSQFKMADPLEMAQKSFALQHLMGQGDLQNMQLKQAQRADVDNERLRALVSSNPADLESALRGGGFLDQSLKVGKDRRENTKLDADTLKVKSEAEKNSFDTQLKRLEHGAAILDSARDQGSWDSALRIGASTGVFAPEFIQKFQGQPFNPQIVEQLKAAGLDRAKQLADQRAREQQAETGRHNLSTEANAAGQLKVSQGQLGVSQGNLGVSRDRLRMEQNAPKGTYDTERGLVIDTRANTAMPVMMGGAQIGEKDKPLNDSQSKALLYASRMKQAEDIFGQLAKDGTNTSVPGSRAGFGVGPVVNALSSANQQSLDQAKRNFINATLRRESGAVISPTEFDNAELQYFPQVGDSAKVIAQKTANRKLAQEGIMAEVPEKKRNIGASEKSGGPANAGATQKSAITTSDIDTELRRRGVIK